MHAAALAYFVPFALSPLLLLSITLVGFIIGGSEVSLLLVGWGNAIDPALTALLYDSVRNFDSLTATFYVPVIALVFFSIMVVIALNSLTAGFHKIWEVRIHTWQSLVARSVRSVLFIILLQVYLVCVILLTRTFTFLVAVTGLTILQFIYPLLLFFGTVILFTLGYWLLALQSPGLLARFYGAAIAAILFLCARALVGLHMITSPTPDLFGAAGLILVLLVWIYISASVIFYGAAFATAYEEKQRKKVSR
jgi:membrane protein